MKIKKIVLFLFIITSLLFAVSVNAETEMLGEEGAFLHNGRKTTLRTRELLPYPMLAMDDTWYRGETPRSVITSIEIADTIDEEIVSVAEESWPAATDKNGDGELDSDIMCYITGTKLVIAGNGSGRIFLNYDCFCTFSDSFGEDYFSSLTEITNADLLDTSKVTTMQSMFLNAFSLKTVDVSNWNTENVVNMSYMFASIISNKTMSFELLDVSNWDTGNVRDMSHMFQFCVALKSLDVSNWDTGNVNSMSAMFQRCKSLATLDVSNWNTQNVTNLSFMFHCQDTMPLGTVDVSNWDVSNVRNFDHFTAHSKLTLKGVENWKNSVVVVMNAMFHFCQNTSFDLSGFDTSNVITFDQMFEGCGKLTEIIGLENFDTSKAVGFSQMFSSCGKLTKLDLSSFDTSNAQNDVQISGNGKTSKTMYNMFAGTIRLKEIKLGEKFSFNGNGTNTNSENMAKFRAQSSTYISGADGMWYNEKGKAFNPADIPDKTAGTYSAVPYLSVKNAKLENNNAEVSVLVEEKLIAKGGKVIIALYNENAMVDSYSVNAQKQVNHTFENLPVADNGYIVKVFCWTLKNLIPLYETVSQAVK